MNFLCVNGETEATSQETDGSVRVDKLEAKDILYIVLSQSDDFHAKEAQKFKDHFDAQVLDQTKQPRLLFTHQDFVDMKGAWTVLPLIERVVDFVDKQPISWVFICEEDTRVDVNKLTELLSTLDHTNDHFLGRELRDEQTTIIHHFMFANNPRQFAYPDFRAGFAMSQALVKSLHERFETTKKRTDFSIDPKHELALFVWDEGKGTSLTNLKQFCSSKESYAPWCVTTQPSVFPDCGPAIQKDDLVVAVKTCGKFHGERVPVVKATWGKEADVIEYFSEVEDKNIPTIDLGVPNTERGHCGKTMAIIRRKANHPTLSAAPWLLIADDDTIINLDQLRLLLSCYRSDRPTALGEKYGYGLLRGSGYNYVTGGGGMVFSQAAVRLLAERCSCFSDDAPDDMTLGMCLNSIGIPVTHSRFFHQARPDDYSPAFLENQIPVSFHKHWNTDPYRVYAGLLARAQEYADSINNLGNKSDTVDKDEL